MKVQSVHARYVDAQGWPKSVSFDEAEFNDDSVDWNDAINGLISEGAVRIQIEIEVEA